MGRTGESSGNAREGPPVEHSVAAETDDRLLQNPAYRHHAVESRRFLQADRWHENVLEYEVTPGPCGWAPGAVARIGRATVLQAEG